MEHSRQCKSETSKAPGATRGSGHMQSAPTSKRRTFCLFAAGCARGILHALCLSKAPESKRRLTEPLRANFTNAKTVLSDHGCGLWKYLVARYP